MARSLMPDLNKVARSAIDKVTGGYASEDEKEDDEKGTGKAVAKQKRGPQSARAKAHQKREEKKSLAESKKAVEKQAAGHQRGRGDTAAHTQTAEAAKPKPPSTPGKPGLPGKK